jgi:hypothetical protein
LVRPARREALGQTPWMPTPLATLLRVDRFAAREHFDEFRQAA